MFVPADRSARFSGAYNAQQRYYGEPDDDGESGSDDGIVAARDSTSAVQACVDSVPEAVPNPPQADKLAQASHAPDRRQAHPTHDIGPCCPWPRAKFSPAAQRPRTAILTAPSALAHRMMVAPWALARSRTVPHFAAIKMPKLR